jgi:Gluconate 2-dehydrogenase subunit 3
VYTTNDIRVLQNDVLPPRRFSRRELAQTLLNGLAASMLSPLASAAHPIHKHLLNGSLLDFADAHLSAKTSKPLFLSAQQLAALDLLSEAIVPGSRKAQSASFIDLLLSADTHGVQQAFLASVSAVEAASEGKYHAAVEALSPSQLHDLLTALSVPNSADHKPFNHLKEWVSGAYYSSEIGMRELGWAPDRVFSTFPGCLHSDGHT